MESLTKVKLCLVKYHHSCYSFYQFCAFAKQCLECINSRNTNGEGLGRCVSLETMWKNVSHEFLLQAKCGPCSFVAHNLHCNQRVTFFNIFQD